jgi:hypothetical protein
MRKLNVLASPALRGAAASLCLLLSLAAQVDARMELPAPGGIQTFYLADKQPLRAEVLSVADGQARLRVHAGGGTLERTVGLNELTPYSAYRLQESITPAGDAQAWLDLAGFAADNGLVSSARRALSRARNIAGDPDLGTDVEGRLSASAADAMIEDFHEDLEAGRLSAAERTLRTAVSRYPDQIDARQGRALQQEFERARAEIERGERSEAAQQEAREAAAAREKELRPLRQRLERGRKEYERALANSKSGSTANRQLEGAIRDLQSVVQGADRVIEKAGNDEVLVREASRVRESAQSTRIDALLASGSLHIVRGQFNPAMGRVNEVLLLEPENKRALAMRGRIEVAANQDGWGWGGRRNW